MSESTPTADELREAAHYTEEQAGEYLSAEGEPALAIGDAQSFTRERPEDRALRQAGVFLHEAAAQASAKMLLLAERLDQEAAVPAPMLAEVRPYLDAYRQAGR